VTTRYLLPCPCGRKVPIEPRQAGEVVGCSCGASLEVPRMLEMAVLERAEPAAATQRSSGPWGVRHSLAVVGAAILLGALGLAIFLLTGRPPPPDAGRAELSPQEIRRKTESLPPVETRRVWEHFRITGPDGRTPMEEPMYEDMVARYQERLLRWYLSIGVAVVVALVGLGLIVVPLSLKSGGTVARRGALDPRDGR
jgi:hypothetical protein